MRVPSILLLLCALILAPSSVHARTSQLTHNDQEWGYAINQTYEEEEPSFWEQLTDPVRTFLNSRTVGRVSKVASGVASAACGDFKGAGEYLANSIINPFLTVESLISDVAVIVNESSSPKKKIYTPRVQLCLTNLLASNQSDANLLGQAVIPFQHVGIIIDGIEEVNFGGANLGNHPAQRQCKEMPLASGEPIGASIQMIECLHKKMRYAAHYNFVNYNCGAYARDISQASGFEFQDLPNAGIGSSYPLLLYSPERIEMNDKMPGLTQECQKQVASLQTIFANLELGKTLTPEQISLIKSSPLSPSSSLQLIAVAARSGSSQVRAQIQTLLDEQWEIRGNLASFGSWVSQNKDPLRKKSAIHSIQSVFKDIPAEGMEWLQSYLKSHVMVDEYGPLMQAMTEKS